MRTRLLGTALALALLVSGSSSAAEARERILYVAEPSGVSLYDIENGHAFLRRIEVPGTANYKGIGSSPALSRLFLSSKKGHELVALDLLSERVVWRRRYAKYPDSFVVTPAGRRIYLPCRRDPDWAWWVIDADTGDPVARIPTPPGSAYPASAAAGPPRTRSVGPHNTWINDAGTRVYLGAFTVPYVTIVDTSTNEVLGRVGPFSEGVRPFTVSRDERYVFANVDGLLGFEVGLARTEHGWGGPTLHRVEAETPSERVNALGRPEKLPHNTPSHGINLRPDGRELWVVDGFYGYLYVYDTDAMPPVLTHRLPLFARAQDRPESGWISFSLDGRYAYPDAGPVLDAYTKRVVTRIPLTEKVIEIEYRDGQPYRTGRR